MLTLVMDHHTISFEPAEVIAGSCAGLAEHLVMFPFDTLKTRMQNEGGALTSHVRQIIRHEKWTHFYRGCVPTIAAAVPAHGVYFALYEAVKRFATDDGSVQGVALAAACATAGHDAVSVPFDVVKQRMQVDGKMQYNSSLECVRSIVAREGPSVLFRSLPATIALNVPHFTTHWIVYETIKRYLIGPDEVEDEHATNFVLAGLTAGACAAVITTPLDHIKTQLQLGRTMNVAQTIRFVLAERGLRGFWVGVAPRVCQMAPSAAIVMTTYETVKGFLVKLPQ